MSETQHPQIEPQEGGLSLAAAGLQEQQKRRFRRSMGRLLFVGVLISLFLHFDILVLLHLLQRGGGDQSAPAAMLVEFAVRDEQELTRTPPGELAEQSEPATEASDDIDDASEVTLEADVGSSPLEALERSAMPSLGGAGSGSAGAGSGGSGGGGGASFFGISAAGSRFCYIVDVSGSMRNQGKLVAAVAELTRSLKALPDFTRFHLLFYSSGVREPLAQSGWNTARRGTLRKIIAELGELHPSGGTQPAPAFEQALKLRPPPDVIFFLTDGEISGFTVADLRLLLPTSGRVVVNTIAFGDDAKQQLLRDMAKATGGQFRFVKPRGAP